MKKVNENIKRLQYDIISTSEVLLDIGQRIESIEKELHTELNDDIMSLLDAIRNISAKILDYESSSLQEYRIQEYRRLIDKLTDKYRMTGYIVENK